MWLLIMGPAFLFVLLICTLFKLAKFIERWSRFTRRRMDG